MTRQMWPIQVLSSDYRKAFRMEIFFFLSKIFFSFWTFWLFFFGNFFCFSFLDFFFLILIFFFWFFVISSIRNNFEDVSWGGGSVVDVIYIDVSSTATFAVLYKSVCRLIRMQILPDSILCTNKAYLIHTFLFLAIYSSNKLTVL